MYPNKYLRIDSQLISISQFIKGLNPLKSKMITNDNSDAKIFLINGTSHLKWLLQTLTNTDIFRELLSNNSTHSFQSSYQTILPLSKNFFLTVLQNKIFKQTIFNKRIW